MSCTVMLFIEFQRKNCPKSGFPDSPLLSSEYRISERDKNESLIKSDKAELYRAFFFYFVCKTTVEVIFKIAGRLTERSAVVAPSAHAGGCGRSCEDFRLQR
ncbi:hypothetical protein QUF90_23035 [Desulfococcaceae bacterium HSG9]|nr:hypothetical protein [Desulfococcaceae bacterium HSG9]